MNPLGELDQRPSCHVALLPLYAIGMLVVLFVVAAIFLRVDRVVIGRGVLVPPSNFVNVAAARPGVVVEILVAEGQLVRAGEPLVRLDDQDDRSAVVALRSQVEVARAEVERRTRLIENRRDLSGVEEVLLSKEQAVEEAGLASLRAEAQRLAKDFERSERELAKQVGLSRQKVVTESELNSATATADRVRAEQMQNEALLAQKQILIEQLEKKQESAVLTTAIDTLREDLLLLEAQRTLASLERLLEEAQLRLKRATIEAPVEGIVHALGVRAPGEAVHDAQTVCRLVPPSSGLIAEIELDAADIGFIRLDQEARIKLDAFPFEDYGALPARVDFIAPDAEPVAGDGRKRLPVYTVRLRVDESPTRLRGDERAVLRPGMTLTAELVNRKQSLAAMLLRPLRAASAEVEFH